MSGEISPTTVSLLMVYDAQVLFQKALAVTLDRVQKDADFRYFMLNTPEYQLLLAAEAKFLRRDLEQHSKFRSLWLGDKPPLSQVWNLMLLVEDLEDENCEGHGRPREYPKHDPFDWSDVKSRAMDQKTLEAFETMKSAEFRKVRDLDIEGRRAAKAARDVAAQQA